MKRLPFACFTLLFCFTLMACGVSQKDVDAAYEQGKQDAYQVAYEDGYEVGYSDGCEETRQKAYDDGFRDGEKEGFKSGQEIRDTFLEKQEEAAYWKGYAEAAQSDTASYDYGYSNGHYDGYREARQEYQDKLTEEDAYWEGYEACYDELYEDGKTYEDGFEAGRDYQRTHGD